MKTWKEHYRSLERLVPAIGEIGMGEDKILAAPNCQDLTFEVSHRNKDSAIVALCRWFEHPSGDCFPDGGMEIKLDFLKKEAVPISIQDPVYGEPGVVLPVFEGNLDKTLQVWLKTLERLQFKSANQSISRL